MSFNDIFGIIIAGLLLLAVAGFLVDRRRRRHQHRTIMRHKHIKIVVDEVSIDVALKCRPEPWAKLVLISDTLKVKGDIDMFSYTTDQRVKFEIVPKDIHNDATAVENIQKTISDPALGEIQALDEEPENPLKFQVISPIGAQFDWGNNSNPRPFSVTITADGKIGEGEVPLELVVNGELTRRDAASLGVNVSAAEDWDPHAE